MYTINNVAKQSNLALAYTHLLTNPESTYKNFFRETYSIYGMASEKNIALLQKRVKAGYIPTQSIRVFMPKANGLNRMYTLLSIEDQIVYQAYANILAKSLTSIPEITKRYKKSVFGNLCASSDSEFFYQNWQDSYKAYSKSIIKAFQKGYKYIASFDLTACYDSINHNLLRTILKDKFRFSDNCAQSFTALIEQWESADGLELGAGIPQGPQASGIVAEVVLQEYDAYIEALQKTMNFVYYRYVDDIRIMAPDEDTVKWVLFLLDKKSKELGLFPQSSKISVHEITDIDKEIKRISKPLFEDEFDDKKKSQIATETIRKLLKEEPADLTSIRRYFQCVTQNTKTNALAISAVKKYPNLIHSFAYYVQRYPRKIPPKISDYTYECCLDKTQQFSAGILLESVKGKLNAADASKFSDLAIKLLKQDRKTPFIVDCRFKAQLLAFILKYDTANFGKRRISFVTKSNWWVKSSFIHTAEKDGCIAKLSQAVLVDFIKKTDASKYDSADLPLAVANHYLLSGNVHGLPALPEVAPIAQNALKESGIILRSRYSSSQINKYLFELIQTQYNVSWKKLLGKEHDQVERTLFTAVGYWKTDLTAFVNLWDTIDDRICSVLTNAHPELGGYNLGKIGGVFKRQNTNGSVFRLHMPKFYTMCLEIHELRLSTHLSHSENRLTHTYTGPIQSNKRKPIHKMIKEGIDELVLYW
ncbi:MAG: RNA-directed DNA polymerase [Clostridia bacterium]|nr:RNA-directed DNA polymerase [Clostridia bacterium]